ncbi:tripartite tricarboxylate transporter substrate binding protein [Verticiella sediminum]|uniref:Tripartite tricarboxylate transporter substrate binding protein n=1 Tax=Verticiella sediminum TaxID=1247510 RepID=A0A556B1F4_9BURK|nr:tripartite tricarboxylate transporter substrate binding protein [Verticiella sediminum]TSH98565.1 tripartite tricarboxylate transporter substrate binding protein [Verticiella sediminum]
MKLHHLAIPALAAALLAGTAAAQPAAAEDPAAWPSRPVTIVVPYPPGGLTDTVTRVLAESLARQTGQSVLVENKPGGYGQIGLDAMLRAPKDGYTLGLVVPATMMTLPLTQPNYRIKPLEQLAPLTIAVDTFLTLVVSPEMQVTDLQEFMTYAKANPGAMNYGTPGAGTSFHFNNVMMAQKMGIEAVHIPYAGEVPMLTDLSGGRLQYALVTNTGKSYIEGGKVRPIAVTARQRVRSLPDVPTFQEAGLDFTSDGWVGYAAAAGTPEPLLERINAALVQALNAPDVRERLANMGYSVVANRRADFTRLVQTRGQEYEALFRSGAVSLKE